RNPIWRGGGIVFGPLGNENYSKKLSKNAKRVAIKQALTLANKAKKITVDDVKTTGKTAEIAKYLAGKKLTDKRVLLVVDDKTPELIRATGNIQKLQLIRTPYLNVFHILNADAIIMSKSSLKTVDNWLNNKEEA
ncbi:50S ribosomal protein L4, partial [Candidatus Saccharibacteria bacterium]